MVIGVICNFQSHSVLDIKNANFRTCHSCSIASRSTLSKSNGSISGLWKLFSRKNKSSQNIYKLIHTNKKKICKILQQSKKRKIYFSEANETTISIYQIEAHKTKDRQHAEENANHIYNTHISNYLTRSIRDVKLPMRKPKKPKNLRKPSD